MTLRIISFGAGVQTTALAIMNAQGRIEHPTTTLVFADTGGEHPETYAYLRDHLLPWAEAHGVTLDVSHQKDGVTLYDYAMKRQMVPSINNRWCTDQFKIRPINAWLRAHGATRQEPADMQIGISADEAHRARDAVRRLYVKRRWPLVELGLTRTDCHEIIRAEGLPDPPKSGCWFCPYQATAGWRRLSAEHPALFAQAVALEANAQARNPKDFLLGGRKSITELTRGGTQMALEWDAYVAADEGCTSGQCFV